MVTGVRRVGSGGCTDEAACNYSEAATEDDGSCSYAATNYDCDGNCLNDADGDFKGRVGSGGAPMQRRAITMKRRRTKTIHARIQRLRTTAMEFA